ncbi:MobQ family relaxase [Sphingomonas sp. Ant20]|uniref:MobQ family relaxase n=1 Tax=Sphingomonas sp. Ant20 TaxID=104605 RepID=UPI00069215D5|nr:MobQ family relaxase [Sphingomonas sp. Ant20]
MAIYHLAVKSVSRSTGRSAVAAVAYRAGVCLENERDGLVHDYTRRGGVEDTFIVTPEGAEWAQDRSALWNAVEAAEKRKDAKVAREYELALPAELDAGQRRDLVRAFAEDIRDRYGVAVDAAIHAPHDYGDDRNHHAHVMTTTRVVDADGLGAKTRQLDVRSSASIEVEEIRASWAAQVNDALELAQVAERVDHRSYARQGVEMEPTVKMGHASAAIERRAEREQIAAAKSRTPLPRAGR